MKTLRLFSTSLFFTVFFAVSILAQPRPQTAAPPSAAAPPAKIAIIDTRAFDTKEGITKYVNARTALQKEFEPLNNELKAMGTRYDNLYKEIQSLREQASKPGSTVSPTTIQTKIDEYGKLEREIKFKQEDAKARSQSRYNTVMVPVLQDIGKAIGEFAKQKGYTLVLDAGKLEETGVVLAVGDATVNVTKDFITFYNARPASAGTAAAGAPK